MSCNVQNELQTIQPNFNYNHINGHLTPHYELTDRFKCERERLKTFDNWPLQWLDKGKLAATGMFYTGTEDRTKCYFCEVIIGKWELQDDPVLEHLRWSPHCPLLLRCTTNNEPINAVIIDQLLPAEKFASYDTPPPLGEWQKISVADYSIKAVRLETFAEWPRCMKQRPEELAEAGFYYKGIGDSVLCFECLGGLKDWETDDDPWEQHALWMGHHCPYVKLMKGEEYIKSVKLKFENSSSSHKSEPEINDQVSEATATELSDDKLCKICFDKECNAAFVPCGHVVACAQCAFASKECPMCRAPITNIVRLYFS